MTTARQQEILDFMEQHAQLRYPTVREIAAHFRLAPATVQQHIASLRHKGCLPESKKTQEQKRRAFGFQLREVLRAKD